MNRPTVLSINAIGLGLVLACSSPARADGQDPCVTDPLCREHEDRGISFSVEKDYASALVEFQTAYARAPIPRLLINIGRSLFRLGQPSDALKYYERFSRAEPNPAPEIAQKLQQYIAEAQVAIAAAARTPEVSITRVDSSPKPRPSDEGEQIAPVRPPPLVGANTTDTVHPPPKRFPGGAGALIGMGVAGLAFGIGLGVRANGLSGEVVGTSGPFDAGLYAQGQTFNQAAIALDVIGGTALAAGGIWLVVWLSRRHAPTVRSASLRSALATQENW